MATEMDLFKTPTEPSFFIGQVQSEIFTSPDSFYKVLAVSVEEANFDWSENEITVTGSFGDLSDDQTYRFEGQLIEHPRYGWQFQANSYHVNQPTSRAGLVEYLASKQFPGVGQKTAEKVVDALGTNAIDKISADPHVLDGLQLRSAIKKSLIENLQASQGLDQVIIGLNDYGFGSNLISSIVDRYGDEALHIISENPYQLATDIDGISFKRADQVARKVGIKADDPRRITAAITQSLDDLTMATGDTYTSAQPLLVNAQRLLNEGGGQLVPPAVIADQIVQLEKNRQINYEQERLYPTPLYKAEYQIADHLNRLMTAKVSTVAEETITKTLHHVEAESGIQYDQVQVQAIKTALNNKVLLLTGGPGTGKTTIIRGIVECYAKVHQLSLDIDQYKEKNFPILLAAPTGRAAKRMSEATDLPASTIHRLLGLNGRELPTDLNARDLKGSLLIVDEMSMVDTLLFKTLVQSVPTTMHVVLVGDKDQLPSVGPGQVFHDLLAFSPLPKVELTNIHRQAADSTIIPLAHAIKEGRVPADLMAKKADRSFIPCQAWQVPDVVEQIIKLAQQRGFSATDVQILAPMYRGAAGVDNLNELAQAVYNPPAEGRTEAEFRGQTFRVGDKVLQLVNSPENNVFNGDIGKIVAIEDQKGKKGSSMTIDFDGNEVTYHRMEWGQLQLAYAISIHKSQGSQFKMVLLPIVRQFSRMLQRNLIYTAITRAADKLVLMGEAQAVATAVHTVGTNRHTTLLARLTERWQGKVGQSTKASPGNLNKQLTTTDDKSDPQPALETGETILTPELIAREAVDPLIGMQGIRPQDL
ncbi:SF1B family DNA helicase RecD2 [Limosilactobacillus sp.]|uniref:SF1B family DNA helicase RecD2 n=1 Tax=Limosilactobacillus sp. TaxID=2773925 RepID=UPI003F000AE5